ncbi:MAG TPA: COX15/CtaA family protein [Pyrinomonadaceae bacterium]|nr:COX15/CtaA family protein [Pyrinomonadaceae bacterium]
MKTQAKMSAFAKYAWFALAYNVLVILWGVFLRASKSGDGCGEHWLTCNGELIPSAPQFKTIIEFSHRMTTAIDGFVMLILVAWAIWIWYKSRNFQSRQVLYAAIGSLFFVITEAAVGAGLVLTGNTAEAVTDMRPFWASGHLVNTFILLAFLTMTAWFASGNRRIWLKVEMKTGLLLLLAVAGLLFVGMSGSLAALSNMLFPSQSIVEGIAKDFAPTSNVILRLRLSHPIFSILTSVYLIFLTGWLKARSGGDTRVSKWSNVVSILVILQVAFGAATLLTFGPIVMQLGHLLLADLVWIAFVLMTANYLSSRDELPA